MLRVHGFSHWPVLVLQRKGAPREAQAALVSQATGIVEVVDDVDEVVVELVDPGGLVVVVVVVVTAQAGQLSGTACPTESLRHCSASPALINTDPSTSHTHSAQGTSPVAALRT